jgi:beta-glucosidase
MPQASFHFPPGFLWGTATAAHQVEGNNTNNDWFAWENMPGRIQQGHKSGLACDWWGGRWKEDLDRASEAGQNAHRFSVEWSRIQPAPDRWDEDALDHYRQMARGMVDRGLTPMVTLHHVTSPLWLAEQGGWENDDTPQKFAVFVRRVVDALKEYVSLWVTINEPNIYTAFAYVLGIYPPGKTDLGAAYHVLCNLLRGHILAYRAIHEVQNNGRAGIAYNYRPFYPAHRWSPPDRLVASVANQAFNLAFPLALRTGQLNIFTKRVRVPEALNTLDYFGLNYYTPENIGLGPGKDSKMFHRGLPQGVETGDSGMTGNVPAEMYRTLKWVTKFNLPILITENGIEDASDLIRPKYLIQHVHQMWRALATQSWPVKGYFFWSQVDNFEWERGWTQRFGLWGLDPTTQVRTRRTSALIYGEICRTNSVSSTMVEKFAPALMPVLFPG